jgi:hypothetical protein
MAMDERRYDHDGRMHVDSSNISKAAVNPYRGEEIPYWDQLGLDPKKNYMLLPHPDELKRAADSFNGLPILDEHVPMTADSHLPYLVVGTTGTNAKFEPPYLTNAISLWTRDAIDAVNCGGKKQLSCAYSYMPVMTPGVYQGVCYDGVMTNLRGNHVALVEEGRAGADCVVGDSANVKTVRRFAMHGAFDQLPKAMQPRSKDGTAAQDEEQNMPMQQLEDPDKISATTNQPRGPTQHETFSRDLANSPRDQFPVRGQASGIRSAAGAEPGTRAPSTQLKNGSVDAYAGLEGLIRLLDLLDEEEDNWGAPMDAQQPIPGQGAPETTGTYYDQEPRKQLPMREAPPTPVKLPAQDYSCGTGDARIMHERRMLDQRVDQFLRNQGMRSEAHRSYVIESGQRLRAKNAAIACDSAGDTLEDFFAFHPGARKIDVLSTPSGSMTANKKMAQDASTIYVWEFNPITNMLEQRQVDRGQFNDTR